VRLAVTLFNQIKLKRALNSVNYEDKSSDLHDVDMKTCEQQIPLAGESLMPKEAAKGRSFNAQIEFTMHEMNCFVILSRLSRWRKVDDRRKREREKEASILTQMRVERFRDWGELSLFFDSLPLQSSPSILFSFHL
jgi:hypothetical protein